LRLGSSRRAALPSNETVTTESVGALTDSFLGQSHAHSSPAPPSAAGRQRHRVGGIAVPYGHPAKGMSAAVHMAPAVGCVAGHMGVGGGVRHTKASPPAAPPPAGRQVHLVVP